MKKLSGFQLAYLVLRLIFGIDLFGHGFVRLAGRYSTFHASMMEEFSKSILPEALISLTGWVIPPWEMIVGALVFIGYKTREGLLGTAAVLFILIFGACMVENWRAVNVILVHSLVCCILLAFRSYNTFCLDQRVSRSLTSRDIEVAQHTNQTSAER